MLIYRPFIPAPMSGPSTFPFPALAICTNAARSNARIVEDQLARGLCNTPSLLATSTVSAGLLLVHTWILRLKEKAQCEFGNKPDDNLSRTLAPILEDVEVFLTALERASCRYAAIRPLLCVCLSLYSIFTQEIFSFSEKLKQTMPEPTLSHPLVKPPPDPDVPLHGLLWDSTPTSPLQYPPSHSPYPTEPSQRTTTHSSSSSRHTSAPLTSAYEQSFCRTEDEDSPAYDDDPNPNHSSLYYQYHEPRHLSTSQLNSAMALPAVRTPRSASYHQIPDPSPTYSNRASYIDSNTYGHGLSMNSLHTMPTEDDDEMKPGYAYAHHIPSHSISDARSTSERSDTADR